MLAILAQMEQELIRDYLRGDISWWDRRCFARRLRSSPDLREKTDSARTLMAALSGSAEAIARGASTQKPPFRVPPFGPIPRGALAVVIVALCALGWLGLDNIRLRRRVAVLRVRESARTVGVQPLFSFVLSPNLTRGDSPPRRLFLPSGSGGVRLELEVPGSPNYSQYRALIRTVDGAAEIWSGNTVAPAITASGVLVDAELPAASLGDNDYVLLLRGLTAEHRWEDVGSYSFGIVHR
jgi:hypothetical protein